MSVDVGSEKCTLCEGQGLSHTDRTQRRTRDHQTGMTPLGFTVFNLANRDDTFRVCYVFNPGRRQGPRL